VWVWSGLGLFIIAHQRPPKPPPLVEVSPLSPNEDDK